MYLVTCYFYTFSLRHLEAYKNITLYYRKYLEEKSGFYTLYIVCQFSSYKLTFRVNGLQTPLKALLYVLEEISDNNKVYLVLVRLSKLFKG